MEPDMGSWQSPDISRSHLYRGTIAWTPPTAIYRAYTVQLKIVKENAEKFSPLITPTKGEQSAYSNHPRVHTVILGRLTTQKIFPHPWPHGPTQARSSRANRATQTLLFSKPFDLAQVCHGNKICSKLALTWETDIPSTLHIELKVERNF